MPANFTAGQTKTQNHSPSSKTRPNELNPNINPTKLHASRQWQNKSRWWRAEEYISESGDTGLQQQGRTRHLSPLIKKHGPYALPPPMVLLSSLQMGISTLPIPHFKPSTRPPLGPCFAAAGRRSGYQPSRWAAWSPQAGQAKRERESTSQEKSGIQNAQK